MMISIVAAMAKNRVIGKDNQMPWHLSADLKHFKSVTLGKPVIMGRKTYESIGKPLSGRRNIVMTRQDLTLPGCDVFHSLESALEAVASEPEVMIIGGANLYAQAIPVADRMILTFVDLDVGGDTFFPKWSDIEWREVSNEPHPSDDRNPYTYRFVTLERV